MSRGRRFVVSWLVAMLLVGMGALATPGHAQTVIFSDTFTSASDVNITAHTPDIGTSWTEAEDTCTDFIENKAATDDIAMNGAFTDCRIVGVASPAPSSPDYDVEWVINNLPGTAVQATSLLARRTDSTHFYALVTYQAAASNQMRIILANGTVPTTATGDLGAANVTWAVGDRIVFELRGSTLKGYQCNPTCTEKLSVTDSTLTAAGSAGIAYGNIRISTDDPSSGNRMDNFIVTLAATTGVGGLVGGGLVNRGLVGGRLAP